jgi:hypothetical protein
MKGGNMGKIKEQVVDEMKFLLREWAIYPLASTLTETIENLFAKRYQIDGKTYSLAIVDSNAEHPLTYKGKHNGQEYESLITQGMRDAYKDAGFVQEVKEDGN